MGSVLAAAEVGYLTVFFTMFANGLWLDIWLRGRFR